MLLLISPIVHALVALAPPSTRSIVKSRSAPLLAVAVDTTTAEEVAAPSPSVITKEATRLLLTVGSAYVKPEVKQALLKETFADEERAVLVLDSALEKIKQGSKSRMARRWPIRLPSRRATMGCYSRLLEQMQGEAADTQRPKRRLLASLLRRSDKSVWAIEGEAIRQRRADVTMEEMKTRVSADLETPEYDVIASRSQWEVRKYTDFAVCSTAMTRPVAEGTSDRPLRAPSMPSAGAFQALASYIFGKNQQQQKMAMTTPVITAGVGDARRMAFVLPSASSNAPPTPVDGAVKLEGNGGPMQLERSDAVAVLWFGGYCGSAEVASRKVALLELVKSDDEFDLFDPADEPLVLQYNDPFTPPWARRNEVAVAVRRRSES